MKTISIAMLSLFSLLSYARPVPSPDQMRENYNFCLRESNTFYLRWGQYLVSYSYSEAQKKCLDQATYGHSSPRLMGCRTQQGWLAAGYYCEDTVN